MLECFIDFEKVFDKVWRDGLWYTFLLNKMNGNMHNVILNMYKDTKQTRMQAGAHPACAPYEKDWRDWTDDRLILNM